MDSNDEPVINITISRPADFLHAAKGQQLPSRNRVVIAQKPYGVSELYDRTRPRVSGASAGAIQKPQRLVPATASSAALSVVKSSISSKGGDALTIPSASVGPPSQNTSVLAGSAKGLRDSRLLVKSSLNGGTERITECNVRRQLSASESQSYGPLSKRKVKPKLTVPTNAAEVSSNWANLRKALGPPKRPPRLRPAAKTAESASAVTPPADPKGVAEVEMPVADAETFVKVKSFSGLTKKVAMDCEFVGIGPGGVENMLARVSLVNQFGHCVYDTFVKPTELIKDYRTHVSGVRPHNLKKGEDFKTVQTKVAEILKNRVLVGHAVRNDLDVLLLSHPKNDIRDTSRYKPFRALMKGGTPSLKKLTSRVLGFAVQTGEHDSIQDAQATMRLYTMHKKEWESSLKFRGKKQRLKQKITNHGADGSGSRFSWTAAR